MIDRHQVRLIDEWGEFWHRHCQILIKPEGVVIPERQAEFNRCLWIPAQLYPSQVLAASSRYFKVHFFGFEHLLTSKSRHYFQDYVIWVRSGVEPDPQLLNLNGDRLTAMGLVTENLVERLVHGLKYFEETGDHLDKNSWTMCAGSRYSCGAIPTVGWREGILEGHFVNPDFDLAALRGRYRVHARQIIGA